MPEAGGSPEIGKSYASILFELGGRTLTRNDNVWPKSVEDVARVSAYPLALWFAASWWRLVAEPRPYHHQPSTAWRMAHGMSAAGHGYLWPPVTFESDGDRILVSTSPSNPLSPGPIRYFEDFRCAVPVGDFENEVSDFVETVLARLGSVGAPAQNLSTLWGELAEERRDLETTRLRRIEARLGYAPDEADESLIHEVESVQHRTGPIAAEEIAPVCAGANPLGTLRLIEQIASTAGTGASFDFQVPHCPEISSLPWDVGRPNGTRASRARTS